MSCRCSDISRCERDIETLSDMISMLNYMYYDDNDCYSSMTEIATNNGQSIRPYNIHDTIEKEGKLHRACMDKREEAYNRCVSELERLYDRLSSMESEDYYYHEDDD